MKERELYKPLKVTDEFMDKLLNMIIDKDSFLIDDVIIHECNDKICPLFISNGYEYVNLKYNHSYLFYVPNKKYIIYNSTINIGLLNDKQLIDLHKSINIDEKYIVRDDLVPLDTDKKLEDYIDCKDLDAFRKPVSKRWLSTKILNFLKCFGYDNATYELNPKILKIFFNEEYK